MLAVTSSLHDHGHNSLDDCTLLTACGLAIERGRRNNDRPQPKPDAASHFGAVHKLASQQYTSVVQGFGNWYGRIFWGSIVCADRGKNLAFCTSGSPYTLPRSKNLLSRLGITRIHGRCTSL